MTLRKNISNLLRKDANSEAAEKVVFELANPTF